MKEPLLSIQIGQNRVEQRGPLDDRLLDRCPFPRVDDEWNRIHWPGIFRAVEKVANVIGDALGLDQLLPALPAAAEVIKSHSADFDKKLSPVSPRKPGGQESLIPVTSLRNVPEAILV